MENIIFDIGNVLLTFDPKEYVTQLFPDSMKVEHYTDIVFGSSQWIDLDRGVLTQKQAADKLCEQYPEDARAIQMILDQWFADMLAPIETSVASLQRLKEQGYRLYALSNFHAEAFAHVYAKYSWFQHFDGMVISADVQTIKPEPKIYQILLDTYKLDPVRSLFIDDTAANLEGAATFGIKTLWFRSADQFATDLREYLA